MDPEIELAYVPLDSEPSQAAEQRSLEINNLFNKLIGYNYNSKFSATEEKEDDIVKFFDTLLWSEKKCPSIAIQLFDMMALEQIQAIHLESCLLLFFKSYILIMGNCKEGGIIAEQLLEHQLPHLFLEAYLKADKSKEDKDELIQYIGSYLKSYHRIFKPEWLHKFIVSEDYFELLEVSFKFFDCPEPLTRTTVFNIVLNVLAYPEVQDFIKRNKSRYQFYLNMADEMSSTLRNELIQFGAKIEQISEHSQQAEGFFQVIKEIEDKVALWEDISRTCNHNLTQLFQIPFSKNVLLPLLVGPLKLNAEPLFTIKYSFFTLRRFLKVIKSFDLLEVLIRIIFVEDNVYFWPKAVQRSKPLAFNILQILNKQISPSPEQEKEDFGANIKKFYEGVLRSKDNHFILMITSFLNRLYVEAKEDSELLQAYGLKENGKLLNTICERLIGQLSETHRLITVESILNTMVILNDDKRLSSQVENQFIFVFKKVIDETKAALKNKSEFWDFIVETNQYQILRANAVKLGVLEDSKKFEEIFKVVFLWDIKEEEKNFFSFYSCIPDTMEDHFRYLYAKFLLLRKAGSYLIDGMEQRNLMAEYYSKFVAQPPYNPGNVLSILQIKSEFHECQIMDGKFVIPALWITDENFFILGHWDRSKKEVKIIMAIKYKHISTELAAKKEKILMSLAVKCYDFKAERLKYKNSITIKGIEVLMPRIVANQIKVREKEMIFITACIKKTEELLPKPSLI